MIAIILPVNRLHTRLAGGQAKSRQGAQVCLWSCEASPLMNRQSLFRRSSALEIENGSARNLLQPGTDQENALRGDDPPVVVIGEPKLTFNLELVLHGVDRAATCDEVWLAAHLSSGHNGRENDARFPKLCRRFVSACSECDRMARLPYWWSYCAGRRRGDPVEGGGWAKTPARFHTDLFCSLFRACRPLGSEKIAADFALFDQSQNFAEFSHRARDPKPKFLASSVMNRSSAG
jgi:hypothetical protein